jgi:hypothetical protein
MQGRHWRFLLALVPTSSLAIATLATQMPFHQKSILLTFPKTLRTLCDLFRYADAALLP